MYHSIEVPDKCIKLWNTCHSLVPDLINNSAVKSSNLVIKSNESLNSQSNNIYLIKSGTVSEVYEGQLVVVYEEGDLIGIDKILDAKDSVFENDFAITVDVYDGHIFLDDVFEDKNKFKKFNLYLLYLNQCNQILMCHLNKSDVEFSPEFREFHEGDLVIEENTEGDDVFTLLSGTAKVMVDNIQVGEIKKDEVFGAIAALTNTKRNASIIATSDCETIVVKSDSFRSLLAARPFAVQKLIDDMARTIVSCNERILELSK